MTNTPDEPIAVLGAGSWGTALALLLARAGAREVRLWDRTDAQIERLRADRENRQYLPGFPLPAPVVPENDIARVLDGAACVVVAVPSAAVRDVLATAQCCIRAGCDVVLAAKGMEVETGYLPAEIAASALAGRDDLALVALSGPNLAVEVARGVPTAAVAACPDGAAAARTRDRFNQLAFRVYTNADRTGVEIGGAVKNVLAIAGGVSDGLGYGDNTKAALLTRGLAEMARFGVACGARAETFYGLSGVGDLFATGASRLSRNWRVGDGLARGETLDAILARLGQVAEGVTTARAIHDHAGRLGVDMPVCAAVARLLFEGASPRDEVAALMGRAPRDE